MLIHSTTELSASPKASPRGDPARRPRGAGRRELALRGRGRRRGPRPPLPEDPPRPTCGRSCRAPREGGGRAALPPPQVPRGRGSPHPGGLGAPAPRRPLPRRAGGSGRRGGGDARAGGGGSPASTGSRPAERGGRQEAELCRSARGLVFCLHGSCEDVSLLQYYAQHKHHGVVGRGDEETQFMLRLFNNQF
ncbi:triple QxxK/R motif-containing protein isoform X9 [Harpia harpyja]|uniref:triple QxxK/R motif-containing protein isoform X9 n=1 Tax=Harpia harpyja TaxID=202280 RepID=UPI0022B21B82|nr:triple QxxK/R motif-containing protein isoform X9 [Harpia harpyja]